VVDPTIVNLLNVADMVKTPFGWHTNAPNTEVRQTACESHGKLNVDSPSMRAISAHMGTDQTLIRVP
jgi:hypothetical protein